MMHTSKHVGTGTSVSVSIPFAVALSPSQACYIVSISNIQQTQSGAGASDVEQSCVSVEDFDCLYAAAYDCFDVFSSPSDNATQLTVMLWYTSDKIAFQQSMCT